MSTYKPGIASAALGSLLRKVQEDKEAQPHRVPPTAQVSSPIRQQVQPPITMPESVGSGKVVSLKPELRPSAESPTSSFEPQVVGFPKSIAGGPGQDLPGKGSAIPGPSVVNPQMVSMPRGVAVQGPTISRGSSAPLLPSNARAMTSSSPQPQPTPAPSVLARPSSQTMRIGLTTSPLGSQQVRSQISQAITGAKNLATTLLPTLARFGVGAASLLGKSAFPGLMMPKNVIDQFMNNMPGQSKGGQKA